MKCFIFAYYIGLLFAGQWHSLAGGLRHRPPAKCAVEAYTKTMEAYTQKGAACAFSPPCIM